MTNTNRAYLNSTYALDMEPGPARSQYASTIDVIDCNHRSELFYGDREYLATSGPVARWVFENIMDMELLGGGMWTYAIY